VLFLELAFEAGVNFLPVVFFLLSIKAGIWLGEGGVDFLKMVREEC